MDFETSVDSPFNHLIQLLAREYFLECSRHKSFKLMMMMMMMMMMMLLLLLLLLL
jgi:hypothetical protein